MTPTKRVLCVEDNKHIRKLLTIMLRRSDLNVIAVSNTGEALRLMEQEQFCLYILDTQLLGVSGFSICEDIRKLDQQTPIIIFSSNAYEADIDAGFLAGANAYLVKPEIDKIIPTVRRLLELS